MVAIIETDRSKNCCTPQLLVRQRDTFCFKVKCRNKHCPVSKPRLTIIIPFVCKHSTICRHVVSNKLFPPKNKSLYSWIHEADLECDDYFKTDQLSIHASSTNVFHNKRQNFTTIIATLMVIRIGWLQMILRWFPQNQSTLSTYMNSQRTPPKRENKSLNLVMKIFRIQIRDYGVHITSQLSNVLNKLLLQEMITFKIVILMMIMKEDDTESSNNQLTIYINLFSTRGDKSLELFW